MYWEALQHLQQLAKLHGKEVRHIFDRILGQIRDYIIEPYEAMEGMRNGLFLEGLGIFYHVFRCQGDHLACSIAYEPETAILASFSVRNALRNEEKDCLQIDYKSIAGKLLMKGQIIKTVFSAYIDAAISISKVDKERKVCLNLGITKLIIFERKLSLIQNQQYLKKAVTQILKPQHYTSKNEKTSSLHDLYSERWQLSIMGCLEGKTNMKQVHNNLDKGVAVTLKYLTKLRETNT